jgi:hypothetical protein
MKGRKYESRIALLIDLQLLSWIKEYYFRSDATRERVNAKKWLVVNSNIANSREPKKR